jgi:hypothetical protein
MAFVRRARKTFSVGPGRSAVVAYVGPAIVAVMANVVAARAACRTPAHVAARTSTVARRNAAAAARAFRATAAGPLTAGGGCAARIPVRPARRPPSAARVKPAAAVCVGPASVAELKIVRQVRFAETPTAPVVGAISSAAPGRVAFKVAVSPTLRAARPSIAQTACAPSSGPGQVTRRTWASRVR